MTAARVVVRRAVGPSAGWGASPPPAGTIPHYANLSFVREGRGEAARAAMSARPLDGAAEPRAGIVVVRAAGPCD